MSEAPNRYPLAWPSGRPRTKNRRRGSFVSGGARITAPAAAKKLEAEITRLGGIYPLISTNIELRVDGLPRAKQAAPMDPGACVYFQMKGRPYALACDTFTEVAQNVAALANHIEATRRIEAYGVASAAETLEAFASLPPPGPRPWRAVLGALASASDVDAAFRRLAAERHPDKGGSHEAMAELTAARDAAKKELA